MTAKTNQNKTISISLYVWSSKMKFVLKFFKCKAQKELTKQRAAKSVLEDILPASITMKICAQQPAILYFTSAYWDTFFLKFFSLA